MLPSTHEVRWRKSSYSGGESGQCVELGVGGPDVFLVRDSKNADGPALAVDWRRVVVALSAGRFAR